MDIKINRDDIVQSDCECIVNAANKSLLGGGGVDGAIHRAAGLELYKECLTLGGCETGEAKITKGYNLKAKWIIHTVGPIYMGDKEDAIYLANCYKNTLDLAKKYGIRTIEFPAISTGIYGYPLREATIIAINSVKQWHIDNEEYEITVVFSCFDDITYSTYCDVYRAINKS